MTRIWCKPSFEFDGSDLILGELTVARVVQRSGPTLTSMPRNRRSKSSTSAAAAKPLEKKIQQKLQTAQKEVRILSQRKSRNSSRAGTPAPARGPREIRVKLPRRRPPAPTRALPMPSKGLPAQTVLAELAGPLMEPRVKAEIAAGYLSAIDAPDKCIPQYLAGGPPIPPPPTGIPGFQLLCKGTNTELVLNDMAGNYQADTSVQPAVAYQMYTRDLTGGSWYWNWAVPTGNFAIVQIPTATMPSMTLTWTGTPGQSGSTYTATTEEFQDSIIAFYVPFFRLFESTTRNAPGGEITPTLVFPDAFCLPLSAADNFYNNATGTSFAPGITWQPLRPDYGVALMKELLGQPTILLNATNQDNPMSMGPGYTRAVYPSAAQLSGEIQGVRMAAGFESLLAGTKFTVTLVQEMLELSSTILAGTAGSGQPTQRDLGLWRWQDIMSAGISQTEVMQTNPDEPGLKVLTAPPMAQMDRLPSFLGWGITEKQLVETLAAAATNEMSELKKDNEIIVEDIASLRRELIALRSAVRSGSRTPLNLEDDMYDIPERLKSDTPFFHTGLPVRPCQDNQIFYIGHFRSTQVPFATGTSAAVPSLPLTIEYYQQFHIQAPTEFGLPLVSAPAIPEYADILDSNATRDVQFLAYPNSFWDDLWGGVKSVASSVWEGVKGTVGKAANGVLQSVMG